MFHHLSPTANRALMVLAVFTFACWSLAAAAVLTWGPGRTVALKTVSRIAERIVERRVIHHVHPQLSTIAALRLASSDGYRYGYSNDEADSDFSWSYFDGEGMAFNDSRDGRRFYTDGRKGRPTFWFREDGVEYEVTDPAIVDEVRRRLQSELSTAQGKHAGRQRELSQRMSELSAQHRTAYRKAKAEVREIARKARRQGKAERPHANA